MSYSMKDVIVDEESLKNYSPIIGDLEVYYSSDALECVHRANKDLFNGILKEVNFSKEYPFKVKNRYAWHADDYKYIIIKKSSSKEYVPFNFKNVEDMNKIRGAWIKLKGDIYTGELQIVSFGEKYVGIVNNWGEADSIDYETLLDAWVFSDGTPCGRKIEE